LPRNAIASAIPVLLIAVAVLQWNRRNPPKPSEVGAKEAEQGAKVAEKSAKVAEKGAKSAEKSAQAAQKATKPAAKPAARAAGKPRATQRRHRPKNYMRYFMIGVTIRALEHERTRRAVIAALRLAQRRA
jgi:hypothetical protein